MNRFPLDPKAAQRDIIQLLIARTAIAPKAPLLRHEDKTFTSEDLLDAGNSLAIALQGVGVNRGDMIAIQSSNRPEILIALIGCALIGAILVPINTASRGNQLAYYIKNSRAKILIIEESQQEHLKNAKTADPEALDNLKAVWILEKEHAEKFQARSDQSILAEEKARLMSREGSSTEPAVVIYTSGTSGPSKGVVCSHAQLFWWGHYSLQNLGVRADDVLYTCLPLFHINALNTFYQALISGAQMVIGQKFSVTTFFQDLKRSNATVTYLLGAMLPMLMSREPGPSEREHGVRIALAPGASEQHYTTFETRTGITVLDGYGSTESNFVICTEIGVSKPGWMGKVAHGFQAKIVDDNDNEVANGVAGELLLRSDEPFSFALGYYEMPEKTVEAWRNLWLHTGDRVIRDDEGNFKFIDRIKDSIRRRGENISSYEVEQVVGAYKGIAEVAAYAVPSELAEDEVKCSVVMKQGSKLDPIDLIKWCEPRLPYFAIPRFISVCEELPKTENGKVQKYKLREKGLSVETWDLQKSGYVIRR